MLLRLLPGATEWCVVGGCANIRGLFFLAGRLLCVVFRIQASLPCWRALV